MWCLSCFKPSTSEDPYEAEINLALAVSQHDADNQEAKQLASAIQESCRLHQLQEKEEKRRTRELEKDEQIALSLQYEESDNKSALDEQPAKIAVESPKDEGKTIQFEEQTNKDEELTLTLQESLNLVEPPPPPTEERKSLTRRAALDVQGQLAKERLKEKEKGKGKVIEDEQFALIVQESLNMVEPPPRLEENSSISSRVPMYEDEQRIIWESLKGKDQITQSEDEVEDVGKLVEVNPRPRSMCGACYCEIEQGRSVDVLGVLWHPECLICGACHNPIAIPEIQNHVSNSRGKFHKNCYRRYCYVCQEKVMIRMVSQHPFWKESYCPSHESDGTHKCCSCERLEPRGTNFVKLDDGRWLCLECMDSAVMDSHEAVPLHIEIREFFEGLNMKIEREFSFLLVETQALNKAEKQEKIDNQHGVVTRGICLSEEQFVTSVSKGPKMGPNKQLIGMATESQRVASEYEVTAILILYGLPRLLTGYILAHEMMHAYLRLNGYKNLNNVTEEGICQVLGHMWLESQTYAPAASSSSSSSSRTPREAKAGKKGEWSEFEKKLVEFCKYQIETDESAVYGDGFRKVNRMVTNSNLRDTLKVILRGRG